MSTLSLTISTLPNGTLHPQITGVIDLDNAELLGRTVGTLLREANLLQDRLADAIEARHNFADFAAYLHGLASVAEGVEGVEVVKGTVLQMLETGSYSE